MCPTLWTALEHGSDRTTNKMEAWPISNYKSKKVTSDILPRMWTVLFFHNLSEIWCQSHSALLCCKKMHIPNNFHYKNRAVSTQLLHCWIHTGNFVIYWQLLNHPEKFINTWECFDFYFSLTTVNHQHKSKQELHTTHFVFWSWLLVRRNFKGIFSSSNCPDQHQGPSSLPVNQHWES